MAQAITTHRFGLWAVLEAGREWITSHLEVENRAQSASHGPDDLLQRLPVHRPPPHGGLLNGSAKNDAMLANGERQLSISG
jgi:hypothetical protein